MENIINKLNMLGVDYLELNDWAIQYECTQNRFKCVNCYLDTMSEESYETISANNSFILADNTKIYKTETEENVEHTIDIFVRTIEKPVIRVIAEKYWLIDNTDIIALYNIKTHSYDIANKQGEIANISEMEQRILKGKAGKIGIKSYGKEGLSVCIHSDTEKSKELEHIDLVAIIDKDLKLTFINDIANEIT